ncbi:MAG: HEAT repeat domain-containing protein [Nitrospirota bacterium]|nr:HEAT repeat domain-containing protein [Nitrospirota bacterium]
MKKNGDINSDLKSMIADYMEKGFLENIIDMFRHDSELYSLIGDLIQDKRIRVRIGITALMEQLGTLDSRNITRASRNIIPLISHKNPVVRGDASNLLGIIGDREAIPFLEKGLSDENPDVRLIAREAIDDITKQSGTRS